MINNNKHDSVLITDIPGVEKGVLKLITMENVGVKKWMIKNKFGKTTPLFENVPYIIPNGKNSVFIIGELSGEKYIYTVHDTEIPEDNFYTRAITLGNVIYFDELDNQIGILTTDRGECLFDKKTIKQKSDIFNNIAFLDNRLIFTKVMTQDGCESVFYGDVNKEGIIGKYLYDEENDNFIATPIFNHNASFDVIDEFKLDEILNGLRKKKSSVKKAKLKILSRLNMVNK